MTAAIVGPALVDVMARTIPEHVAGWAFANKRSHRISAAPHTAAGRILSALVDFLTGAVGTPIAARTHARMGVAGVRPGASTTGIRSTPVDPGAGETIALEALVAGADGSLTVRGAGRLEMADVNPAAGIDLQFRRVAGGEAEQAEKP